MNIPLKKGTHFITSLLLLRIMLACSARKPYVYRDDTREYLTKLSRQLDLDSRDRFPDSVIVFRIWYRHHVVELRKNGDRVQGIYVPFLIRDKDQQLFYKKFPVPSGQASRLTDTLIKYKPGHLPESTISGIDAGSGYFEIRQNGQYRIQRFGFRNTDEENNVMNLARLARMVFRSFPVDSLDRLFIRSLPPGSYSKDMFSVHVDRFCRDNTQHSTLYREVERILKNEFGLSDNSDPTRFPLIFLNDREVFLCDLNRYERDKVKKIYWFTPDDPSATALYGMRAQHGVIIIRMK